MKKLFTVFAVAISLICLVVVFTHFFKSPTTDLFFSEIEDEQTESKNKLQFIEAAFKQEFERTKDPNSNAVPRERLLTAANEVKRYMKRRTNLAISGISWQERGPSNVGGRTRALIFDRSDVTNNSLFAGGVAGGLWKCTNLSGTPVWTKLNDLLDNIAISCIIQDPNNVNILYAGTGETWGNVDALRGLGIWKSSDAGTSWIQLASTNNSNFYYTQKIIINTAGNIFAATSSGLKKSTDGGTTWINVLTGDIADLEVAANNDLYASNFFGRVYKSTAVNAGAAGTWTNISPAGVFKNVEIATAPSDPQKLYLLCEGPTSQDCDNIFRSDNGGASWVAGTVPTITDQGSNSIFTRSQAWYDLIAAVDPNAANTVVIGGIDAVKSTDGGLTWKQVTTWSLAGASGYNAIVHADHHATVFAPGSSSRMVWGTDGGVYFTDNLNVGGATKPTVAAKNDGYNVTQFYCGAIHPTAGTDYFLGGAQDNGSQKFNGAGIVATTSASGGDGAFCHIDQLDPTRQFTSYVYCSYYRSINSGGTFTNRTNDQTRGSFINPTDYDPVTQLLYGDATTVSTGAGGSYSRWNTGNMNTLNFIAVTQFGTASVTNTYVSPNTAARVYFGLNNGSVVYVDGANTGTGTKTGTVLKTGIGSVSGIAIQPGNENHVLVTYSNYGVQSVWETTTAGTTWTNIEGNLPDMPVRSVIFNPASSTQALIATELGVWTTSSLNGASTDWSPTNGGLANTRVDILKVRTSDNTILAATHGRGLFTTTLINSTLPTTNFQVAQSSIGEAGNVSTPCGLSYRDVPVTMNISNAPASNVTVSITVSPSSTATLNQDFSLSTSTLTFAAGITTPQTFNIRVLDDYNTEATESVVLNYTITSGGGAAMKGNTFQNFQLDITDNDNAPNSPYTGLFPSGSFTTNLGGSSPLQATQSDKKIQYLYKASELLSNGLKAGAITSFNFSVNSKGSNVPYNGFTIKIAETTVTDLSAGFVSPAPSFNTIYSGTYTPISGENEFAITGFTWNGTSNILFEYCYDNSVLGTADDILNGEQTAYTCQAKNASTTTSNAGCSFATSTLTNLYRPVLIFSQLVPATSVETILSSTKQAAIGPFEAVSFFDASGNIIATVKNLDAWDYGCTTITIDRSGTSATAFWNNSSANYVASKTVTIVPANNNAIGNIQVTLYYTAAEKAGWESVTGQAWGSIGIVKVKNAQILNVTPANPMTASVSIGSVSSNVLLGSNYAVTGDFSSGFSGFGVGIVGSALPVKWLSFTGKLINSHSSLSWSTSSEINSKNFDIEKSINGIFFYPIGSVDGAGFSNTIQNYFFTDPDLASALQYYRLRQNDFNGHFIYSDVLVLRGTGTTVSIGPNPFKDKLFINFTEQANGNTEAVLYNASGKQMMRMQTRLSGTTWSIDLKNTTLSSGTYLLKITANGKANTYKVIKE
ncbi:MAG: T9SS type A sorting domain-containing protein [Ferruginibacter sp.]